MNWWQSKRDADLERRCCDLELEAEGNGKAAFRKKRLGTRPYEPLAIRLLYGNRLSPSGRGIGLNPSFVICALVCARFGAARALLSSQLW